MTNSEKYSSIHKYYCYPNFYITNPNLQYFSKNENFPKIVVLKKIISKYNVLMKNSERIVNQLSTNIRVILIYKSQNPNLNIFQKNENFLKIAVFKNFF